MADYTDAYKKYFTEKLGLPVEEFDNILTSAKKPSAEQIAKMNKLAKIAMDSGSMEEISSLTPEEQFTANQMRNKMNVDKSLAKKIPEYAKVAEEKLVGLENNIAKAIPATQAEKMAGKAMLGKMATGAGKIANKVVGPLGPILMGADLLSALSEVQDKGAAKIAADYANQNAPMGVKKITQSSTGEQTEGPERMVSTSPITKEEFNAGYSPEERMRLKEMLKKLRAEAKLRQ